ncbi:hypothetical protein WR25_18460 [Diploscapter pachys]|uniref:Uncharacterized protein n=1 Tax=Diploscapter pachys TaxID=2018661 RepID=A0A2A2LLB2_9BILA|nr:hypothetical protein WR25_18460 [Diploscapter pachys]
MYESRLEVSETPLTASACCTWIESVQLGKTKRECELQKCRADGQRQGYHWPPPLALPLFRQYSRFAFVSIGNAKSSHTERKAPTCDSC